MKLIIAIVQNEDAYKVSDALMHKGYSVTKLATTGGFLKMGNTTLLIGVEKEQVDKVVKIIKEYAQSREQTITTPLPSSYSEGIYTSFPINVQVGGATLFVVDVDKFEKF